MLSQALASARLGKEGGSGGARWDVAQHFARAYHTRRKEREGMGGGCQRVFPSRTVSESFPTQDLPGQFSQLGGWKGHSTPFYHGDT